MDLVQANLIPDVRFLREKGKAMEDRKTSWKLARGRSKYVRGPLDLTVFSQIIPLGFLLRSTLWV